MKIFFIFIFAAMTGNAQNLTQEEQKRLIEENKFLKEEILKLKSQQSAPQNSAKIMEALQKGKTFQEEQQKALEELDKED